MRIYKEQLQGKSHPNPTRRSTVSQTEQTSNAEMYTVI